MPGLKIIFLGRLLELLPRTHQLAVITTKHPIAHGRAQFFRNTALELNGEIADAAPGIQYTSAHERIGRAHFEAGRAAATVIGFKGWVYRQWRAGEYFSQKKERARLRMN